MGIACVGDAICRRGQMFSFLGRAWDSSRAAGFESLFQLLSTVKSHTITITSPKKARVALVDQGKQLDWTRLKKEWNHGSPQPWNGTGWTGRQTDIMNMGW